jgi:hypothetical protein
MTVGGVCVALSVISVVLASIVPGFELTLYGVSSVFIAVMIVETGIPAGVMVYVATVFLSLILVPNKLGIIPYVFFFGIYAIVKYFAEKVKNPVGQVAIKVVCFAAIFGVAWFFFKALFFANIDLPKGVPFWVLAIVAVLVFVLYDYILTLIIKIYRRKVKHDIPKDFKLSK